ncbi:MAG: GIY-YIG nuclease family protein [Heliobacteriaceae bacterium]|jgi:putative endonuclease|nr:GIY-YIG nuclease family protein [Heliobacteriaceae bacterium]
MKNESAVYIMTNYLNTTFYIGVTNNLLRRICEHKTKQPKSFTAKYNLNKLVYFEIIEEIELALNREKQLKNWKRDWKVDLIRKKNPNFRDLSFDIGFSNELIDSGTSP